MRDGLRVDLPCVIDRDGGGVDEQRAGLGGGQHLGIGRFHDAAVGQRRDDHLGTGDRLGAAAERVHALGFRGVLQRGDGIEAAHGVTGRNQVGRHRTAHVAQTQECDCRH